MLCLLSLVQGTSPASLTCPGGGSPQTYYANYEYNEYYPVITQNPTTPLSITLGSTQPNADAFWLHNDDGDLIGFQNVAGSATFDLTPYQPEAVTAFVYIRGADPALSPSSSPCIIAASNVTLTVQGQIAEYYRSAGADVCCNVPFSSWSAADRLAATPAVNVDYDARTATVTVAVSPGMFELSVSGRRGAPHLLDASTSRAYSVPWMPALRSAWPSLKRMSFMSVASA